MSNRWTLLLLSLCRLALADSVPDPRVHHADRLIAEGRFTDAASEYQSAYAEAKQNGAPPERLADAADSLGAAFVLLTVTPKPKPFSMRRSPSMSVSLAAMRHRPPSTP